ncbi:tryptophan-rich sensory protein [Azospirillum doebereinerae]|uniref:Tryptophan-rich sensory protein n=1 Tax=Azospirillum doebereinerae TaxID=92933 RepID=A0A3S0V493_9PROT|nr:TspO/MBR family protein [Azospirillum doebereinerae]MCG5242410.1 tryptophan-rich sensory protein [Azospirillum doebereinerae]RUQ66128.1 tryptophan-rich sensory protein [Azospirillum doebereinerae]
MTDTTLSSRRPPSAPFRVRWWQPLLFWLLVNAWGFVERGTQPFAGHAPSPLQPPGWVFPVMWFSLNIVQLWGDLRLLDPARPIRHRGSLLALQAVSWAIYATFALVYFTLGSPILAAAWTIGFFVVSSACIALVIRDDRSIAALWLPLILWTGFASVVGVHNALLNPDPLFGTPALWPR